MQYTFKRCITYLSNRCHRFQWEGGGPVNQRWHGSLPYLFLSNVKTVHKSWAPIGQTLLFCLKRCLLFVYTWVILYINIHILFTHGVNEKKLCDCNVCDCPFFHVPQSIVLQTNKRKPKKITWKHFIGWILFWNKQIGSNIYIYIYVYLRDAGCEVEKKCIGVEVFISAKYCSYWR